MWGNACDCPVKRTASCFLWMAFFVFLRGWVATVFWGLQLLQMLAAFVKATTPPARSIKDNTPSSITLTVRLFRGFIPKTCNVLELFFFLLFLRVLWSGHHPSGGSRYTCDRTEHIQLLPGHQGCPAALLSERTLDSGLARAACYCRSHFWVQEAL